MQVAVEHVLYAVAGVEDTRYHAAARFLHAHYGTSLPVPPSTDKPDPGKFCSLITPSFKAHVSSAMPSVEKVPISLARYAA